LMMSPASSLALRFSNICARPAAARPAPTIGTPCFNRFGEPDLLRPRLLLRWRSYNAIAAAPRAPAAAVRFLRTPGLRSSVASGSFSRDARDEARDLDRECRRVLERLRRPPSGEAFFLLRDARRAPAATAAAASPRPPIFLMFEFERDRDLLRDRE